MPNVLIIDWDTTLQQHLAQIVREAGFKACLADHPQAALAQLNATDDLDMVIYAEAETLSSFQEFMEASQTHFPHVPIVFLAKGHASARAAMQHGASECLVRPLTPDQFELTLTRLRRWNQTTRWSVATGPHPSQTITGQSPSWHTLQQSIRKLARTHATVLILGEPGAGKTHTAQALFNQSHRARQPWQKLDAALLSAEDFHQALVGGAALSQPSALELSHQGTLLIENVDRLPAQSQQALLQILETGSWTRPGSTQPQELDLRLLVTSTAPLDLRVQAGTLREDLAIALSLLTIHVPPLRERASDIPALADHFRDVYATQYDRPAPAISSEALALLASQPWPGNLTELENVMRQAVLTAMPDTVLDQDTLLPLLAGNHANQTHPAEKSEIEDLAELEKQHIFYVLRKCGDNRTHAARRLGISIRTLRNKLREYRQAAQAAASQSNVPSNPTRANFDPSAHQSPQPKPPALPSDFPTPAPNPHVVQRPIAA